MHIGTLTRPVRLRHAAARPPGRLAAAIMCVALAACHGQRELRDPDPPTSDQTATAAANSPPPKASATTRPSRVYQATGRPCDLVDHHLLARLFGPDSGDVTPPQYTRTKFVTTMACNRSYSRQGTDSTIVPVRIALADPAAIEAQYQGLRSLHEKRAKLTDVPGLGQGAYTYIDNTTGPQLALYDGNALVTVGAVPVSGSVEPPAQILVALIEVAQRVLTTLKT